MTQQWWFPISKSNKKSRRQHNCSECDMIKSAIGCLAMQKNVEKRSNGAEFFRWILYDKPTFRTTFFEKNFFRSSWANASESKLFIDSEKNKHILTEVLQKSHVHITDCTHIHHGNVLFRWTVAGFANFHRITQYSPCVKSEEQSPTHTIPSIMLPETVNL